MNRSSNLKALTIALVGTSALAVGAPAYGLDEIVVSARKRDENLLDVPVAVTAFSAQDIQRQSLQTLDDIALTTPGFSFEGFVSNVLGNPVIRGLAQTQLTNPVQNVSTFIDGIYLQNGGMVNITLQELERVEIVKGPQSALYGRNAFGGAINYVTKKPTNEFEAMARGTVGSDERYDGQISLSGPIIEDMLLVRAEYGYSTFDGTWDNINTIPGADDRLGGWENQSWQASAVFTPTDRIEIGFGYTGNDLERELRPSYALNGQGGTGTNGGVNDLNCSPTDQGFAGVGNTLYCGTLPTLAPLQPNDTRTQLGINLPPQARGSDTNLDLFRANLDLELNDNFTFKYLFGDVNWSSTTRGSSSRDPNFAFPFGLFFGDPTLPPGSLGDNRPNIELEQNSHEFRLEGTFDGINAGAGGYISDVDTFDIAQTDLLSTTENVTLASFLFDETALGFETWAIFGYADWNFLPQWTINFEGRYTEETITIERIRGGLQPIPIDDPSRFDEDTYTFFTPRVILEFDPTDDIMFYASAARGAKAGGFNNTTVEEQQSFDPEFNWTYEIGSKGGLFDGQFFYEIAAFYIDWSDVQTRVAQIGGSQFDATVIDNFGEASSYGVEISGVWSVTDTLTANIGYGFSNPEWGDGAVQADIRRRGLCDGIVCDVDATIEGNQLARTSKHQVNAGLLYENIIGPDLQYFLRADVNYQSRQFLTDLNVGDTGDRTLVNLRGGIGKDAWLLEGWARNVFDEQYVASSLFISFGPSYVAALGDRRAYGATLTLRY